jgi:hypothetical protein
MLGAPETATGGGGAGSPAAIEAGMARSVCIQKTNVSGMELRDELRVYSVHSRYILCRIEFGLKLLTGSLPSAKIQRMENTLDLNE